MLAVVPAAASADPASCPPDPVDHGEVVAVIDADLIALGDGRIIRLAGLHVAKPDRPGAVAAETDLNAAARAYVREAVEGRTVGIAATMDEPDRYGRVVTHVMPDHTEAVRWLQGGLVAAGLARVDSQVDKWGCGALLLEREETARQRGLGLWATRLGTIFRADRPDELTGEIGRFAIVEGKVVSVGERPRRTYLNFGTYWNEDFTAYVDRRHRAGFERSGLALGALAGQHVRVRGFVIDDRGPAIRMTGPGQLERVD